MTNEIKLAMIGAGKMAAWHLRAYGRIPGIRCVALSSPTPARGRPLAKKFGIERFYRDPLEMLDREKPDAVDICVPAEYHKDYIVAALERGIHLYVEKPMCVSEAEAREVIEANGKAKRILFNGFNYRYWPETQKIRAAIDSGKLGEIRFARMIRLTKDTPQIAETHQGRGDLFWDFHSHFIDLLFLFGFPDPEKAMAMGVNVHNWPMRPDTGALLLSFPSGAMAELTTSSASPGLSPQILLIGTHATLRLDYGRVTIVPQKDEWALPRLIAMMFRESLTLPYRVLRNPFLPSCRHFVQCVIQGAPSDSNEFAALRVLRVTEAAVESCETGHPIDLSK